MRFHTTCGIGTSLFCAFSAPFDSHKSEMGLPSLWRLLKEPEIPCATRLASLWTQQDWNAPWHRCNIKAAFTNQSSRCAACVISFRIRRRAFSLRCSGAGCCPSSPAPLWRPHPAIAPFPRSVSMQRCPSFSPRSASSPRGRFNSRTTSTLWRTRWSRAGRGR